MRLADATVLITGATGGIGRAAALRLRDRGARLVLSGRDADALGKLAAEVGGRAVPADLAGDVGALAGLDVDVLVHCAGVGLRAPFAAGHVDRLLAVNLRAPLALTAALLPGMRARGRGHLAYVASIAGLTGVRDEAVYAATKAGVLAFAASLRLELDGTGVTVSTISPGAVATGFWAARGAPYHRKTPRPIPAGAVARVLVAGIEAGAGDQVVPRWLRSGPVIRALSPRAFHALARRMDHS